MLHKLSNGDGASGGAMLAVSAMRQNGCPVVSAQTIEADAYAASYVCNGDVHHKALLDAALRAAPAMGYGAASINLLRVLFNFTRKVDWEDGRPICFASNENLAGQIGKTVSAIKKQLRELANAGLISRDGDGNGKRIGGRYGAGLRKGHLRDDTVGINLAPLASKFDEHMDAIAEYEQVQEQLRTMAITARRFVRNIGQMREQCIAYQIDRDTWTEYAEAVNTLAPEIMHARHSRNAHRLAAALDRLAEAHTGITEILREYFAARDHNNITPQGGKKCPHIPVTTPKYFSESIKGSQEEHGSEAQPDNEISEHPETFTEHGVIKASEIPYLFPNFGAFWSDRRQTHSFEAIAKCISEGGHSFIGIRRELWERTLSELPLGYPQIMFAITLEWLADHPEKRNPGGYFIGMVRKYNAGQLNLHGTVMGRRKQQCHTGA
jgi:replication initiation protein RepC